MKIVLRVLVVLILAAVGIGYYFRLNENFLLGDRIIGLAVLASAFILMPLWLYHSWKGKKFQDYTLTDKNIKKMKDRNKKKRE